MGIGAWLAHGPFLGSWSPWYMTAFTRLVSKRATAVTTLVCTASGRMNVVHSTGSPRRTRPVAFQTPSSGRAGEARGVMLGGPSTTGGGAGTKSTTGAAMPGVGHVALVAAGGGGGAGALVG